jgi:TonB family protein
MLRTVTLLQRILALIKEKGGCSMRSSSASAALAAALGLTMLVAAHVPALSQDFSITNQEAAADAGRRDVMRQLQAWWNVHAYYPSQASENDERGTVKLHLVINPDGVWNASVARRSGSRSLDRASISAFNGGFVKPLAVGASAIEIDISLHYVLAQGHDQPGGAGFTPVSSRSPFTITDDPVKSPILGTMLQRACTGTVVKEGIRNHPAYGVRYQAQAIFFRRPDGTPWVKFYEGGFPILSPVTEVGKSVQWTGREEHVSRGLSQFTRYTVWPDGGNNLGGYIEVISPNHDPDAYEALNHGGTVDFTCATDIVPAITWNAWSVTPGLTPPGDPP